MDREKVIKGLQKIPQVFLNYYASLISDPVAMINEQEMVEPKKVKGYNPPMYTFYEYECKKCKAPIMNKQPFCMGCGRPVMWK